MYIYILYSYVDMYIYIYYLYYYVITMGYYILSNDHHKWITRILTIFIYT